jgi:hypothetical protein
MSRRSGTRRVSTARSDQALHTDEFVVLPGQLFWIPTKEKATGDLGLRDTAYNHPCVVLSDASHNGKHTILIVSQSQPLKSLNGIRY